MIKKVCSSLLVAAMCIATCVPVCAAEKNETSADVQVYNVSTQDEQNIDNLSECKVVNPQYSWDLDDGFDVGSTYCDIKFWVDYYVGGVSLSSNNDCDFRISGTAKDTWDIEHDFSGGADQTTYCEASGRSHSMTQISSVYAACNICSDDGENTYENTISFLD